MHTACAVCELLWGELQGKGSCGSVEGRYFITNLLFVPPHPSALLPQIGSHLGRETKAIRGAAGLEPRPGPAWGTFGDPFPFPRCRLELTLQIQSRLTPHSSLMLPGLGLLEPGRVMSCLNPPPGWAATLKGPLASGDWGGGALLGLQELLPHHTPQKWEGDLWWGGAGGRSAAWRAVNSSAAVALAPPCWERVRVLLKVVCAARLPLTPPHTPPAFWWAQPGFPRFAEGPGRGPLLPPPALRDAHGSAPLQRVLPLSFLPGPALPAHPLPDRRWVRPGTKRVLCL